MKIENILRIGKEDIEPRCLVEGVRGVRWDFEREVQLHFQRVPTNLESTTQQ